MSDESSKQAEINKVLHVLNARHGDFPFLHEMPADELHRFFLHMQQAIQLEQTPLWEKLSRVVRFVPAFISAKIAESTLGANITANITYHVSVTDAISIAKQLSIPFLAEVSENLIPEKSKDLLNAFPMDLLRKIVDHMLKKQMHYTIAGFVDYLERWKVNKLSDNITDEKDLIRISVFVQDKKILSDLVQGFTDDRLFRTIHAAHVLNEHDELFSIYNLLEGDQRDRVLRIIETRLPEYIQENYKDLLN